MPQAPAGVKSRSDEDWAVQVLEPGRHLPVKVGGQAVLQLARPAPTAAVLDVREAGAAVLDYREQLQKRAEEEAARQRAAQEFAREARSATYHSD